MQDYIMLYNRMNERAVHIGCCIEDKRLFFVKHVYSNTVAELCDDQRLYGQVVSNSKALSTINA
jgi:trans-2-enoyl-CoA reductase